MLPGFKLIQIPGLYGYRVTVACWLRRTRGDEWWIMPGAVTLLRTSGMRSLDEVAFDGPKRDHKLGDPWKLGEDVNRWGIMRSKPANLETWLKHVPKPEGWEESLA